MNPDIILKFPAFVTNVKLPLGYVNIIRIAVPKQSKLTLKIAFNPHSYGFYSLIEGL